MQWVRCDGVKIELGGFVGDNDCGGAICGHNYWKTAADSIAKKGLGKIILLVGMSTLCKD